MMMIDDDGTCHHPGFSGRGIVDFIATELERNIALELRTQDGTTIPDKIGR